MSGNGLRPPIFFSILLKRKRVATGPKEKAVFLPRSGAVALRADGGLPNWCRLDLLAICRLAPDRSFALASFRVFGTEVAGVVDALSLLLLYPQGVCRIRCRWAGGRRGPLQRADGGVRPYGHISGRTFCRGGCPHPPVPRAELVIPVVEMILCGR